MVLKGKRIYALLGVLAATIVAVGAFATSASALPPCGFDCPPPPVYTPYPFGTFDTAIGYDENGTSNVITDDSYIFTGYAIDWDAGFEPIDVRVDVYRWDSTTTPYWSLMFDHSELVLADQLRSGLSRTIIAYAGPDHGFRVKIPAHNLSMPMGKTWLGQVCMTAVNVGPGADRPLLRYDGTFQTTSNCWTNIVLT